MIKVKKIFSDIGLNAIAVAINLLTLQGVALPWLCKVVGGETYGMILTMVSVFNIVSLAFGGALNSVRLLRQNSLESNGKIYDFNLILSVMTGLTLVITFISQIIVEGGFSFLSSLLSIIASLLYMVSNYYTVAYRIELNYVKVVIYYALLAVGYMAGAWLVSIGAAWQWIYILGYGFGFIYLIFTTKLIKESYSYSDKISSISWQTGQLVISNIFNLMLNYADKLVVYPMFGGTEVSILNCATFFVKALSVAINPITSVALSYLGKMKNRSQKLFSYTAILGALFCVLGYIASLLIAKPVMTLLYPQFAQEAMQYVYYTAASAMIMCYNGIMQPFVLKFAPAKWQIMITGIPFGVYMLGIVLLTGKYQILGVCIASVISRIIRCAMIFIVYFTSDKKKSVNAEELEV